MLSFLILKNKNYFEHVTIRTSFKQSSNFCKLFASNSLEAMPCNVLFALSQHTTTTPLLLKSFTTIIFPCKTPLLRQLKKYIAKHDGSTLKDRTQYSIQRSALKVIYAYLSPFSNSASHQTTYRLQYYLIVILHLALIGRGKSLHMGQRCFCTNF